jgi:retron-type reverse transcriptase
MMLTVETDAFGWAQKENLRTLGKNLREGSYQPSLSTKMFIPKSSGLLRPITILRVKDDIVYQAIADILSEKAKPKLSKYYMKTVFSNIVNASQLSLRILFRTSTGAKE